MELERQLADIEELKNNTSAFVKLVERYENIDKLDYEILHEFIDRILIHELDRVSNTREIEIFYRFVGKIESSDKPQNESFFRQLGGGVNIKSIVI